MAEKPKEASIEGAINFVRALGPDALALEPALHADGTVILETPDGWTLRFLYASKISAVLSGWTGIVHFDRKNAPKVIKDAIEYERMKP